MRDIKEVFLQWLKFFEKKKTGSGIKTENISNKELAEELYKPVIRHFNKRKVHSAFIDNICGPHVADMQLISQFNKGFRFYYALLIFIANMFGSFL